MMTGKRDVGEVVALVGAEIGDGPPIGLEDCRRTCMELVFGWSLTGNHDSINRSSHVVWDQCYSQVFIPTRLNISSTLLGVRDE